MNYNGRTHTIRIGELTRSLPLFEVAPNVRITIFNICIFR
jgi:hypothetical protein